LDSVLTITDEHTAYAVSAVIQNNSHADLINTMERSWFNQYGFPKEIHFKKGKVEVSQLTQKINQLSLPPTKTTVQGKS
jgi:hypothetical protein